jgi:hypothetical protein
MELIAHFEYDAKLPQLATKLGAVALIDTGAQARALMLIPRGSVNSSRSTLPG